MSSSSQARRLLARVSRTDLVIVGIYAVLVTGYVIALMIGKPTLAPGPGNIVQGGDSELYRYAGAHWPWDPTAARVAPLFPWLLTLCFRNVRAVVIVQSFLSVCMWTWLGYSLKKLITNPRLGYGAFIWVLALSLSPEVVMWNGVIGSEAVSIITLVATLAAFATAVRVRSPRWWVGSSLVGAFSVFARDTNALVAVAIAIVSVCVAFRPSSDRPRATRLRSLAVVAICVTCVLVNNAFANRAAPPRWYFPVQENILRRVLPDPELTKWFEGEGLPQVEALRSVSGSNYFMQHPRLEQGNEFSAFRAWLLANGQSVYSRFLISHPLWSAKAFVTDRDYVWLPSVRTYTFVSQATPGAVFGLFGAVAFWRSSELILALCAACLVALLIGRLWSRGDGWLRFGCGVSMLVGLAHAFASYVSDDLEVGRHVLTANVHVRLTIIAIALLALDRALTMRRGTDAAQ